MTQQGQPSTGLSNFVREAPRPDKDHELLLREANHGCTIDL
jgi:hypothetical protein